MQNSGRIGLVIACMAIVMAVAITTYPPASGAGTPAPFCGFTYVITNSSGLVSARNCITGNIDFTSATAANTVFNSVFAKNTTYSPLSVSSYGYFTITGNISLKSKVGWDGHYATQIAVASGSKAEIALERLNNVKITGVSYNGNSNHVPTVSANRKQDCILLHKTVGVYIENNALTNCPQSGVFVGASRWIWVQFNNLTNIGQKNSTGFTAPGIFLNGFSGGVNNFNTFDVWVIGNSISNFTNTGITQTQVQYTTISNNHLNNTFEIYDGAAGFNHGSTGIGDTNSNYSTITENKIFGIGYASVGTDVGAIGFASSSGNAITSVVVTNNVMSHVGIALSISGAFSSNVTAFGNTVDSVSIAPFVWNGGSGFGVGNRDFIYGNNYIPANASSVVFCPAGAGNPATLTANLIEVTARGITFNPGMCPSQTATPVSNQNYTVGPFNMLMYDSGGTGVNITIYSSSRSVYATNLGAITASDPMYLSIGYIVNIQYVTKPTVTTSLVQ